MEVTIETQGRYGSDDGAAAGKPYGRARFATGDGWLCEAAISMSLHHPDVYLFDCRVVYGWRIERVWAVNLELKLPFEQAASFILGVMLQTVVQRRKEVFGEPLPLVGASRLLPAA